MMSTTIERERHFATSTIDGFMILSPWFDKAPFKQIIGGFDKCGPNVAEAHMQRIQYLVGNVRTPMRISRIVAAQRRSHLTKMS